MSNVYNAEGLMRALQLYSIAKPMIESLFTQGANYETVRAILVIQMKCTYGAATDYIETWEQITQNKFER